jgi:TP901 family phage tail tape measure protein
MASAFNLTAQINLRGPSNVRNIVSDIRRQLGTITGDVNLRINPATTRNVTVLNTALTTLNNNLTITTNNATNAANAIRQFGASIAAINNNTAGLNRNLNNAAAAANNAADNIGNAGRQTREASGQMVEFGRTAGLAVRRFAAFSMSAGAIMGLTNAMRQGIDAFIDYDKQFVKLQQVTGESASGLSQLSNTITQLSTSLGVSSKDLTEVSLTLTQAGLTARDTERALKALALSSLAPSFDNMNQTVEGSIALMRQFGISATDLEKALGAVNSVSAKFAVEASDIIAAIQRTGGVFASASKGVSEGTDALNEFIAVFTSVRATTRESAETIATGLRTIFTRIQRGGTIEALKEFGVNLTDAEGKFVGAYKAVQLLSEGLNQIDPRDLKFSEIVEELGGFRQIGKVIPLIQQFATAQDALRVAQQGQGSLTMDAAKAQASLANQAAKVREEFLALFREIGGSDTFQALAKGALGLASALISVADSVKGVLPVLAIMMAFRGASGVRQFGSGFLRGFRANGAQGAKNGGFINKYARGGNVAMADVALMPGEAVVFPQQAQRIGTSTLRRMNYADKRQKRAGGGKIGMVPGQGNSDSFYTKLPVGSFVIRKKATEAMGPGFIQDVASGRQKFATGGVVSGSVSGLGGSLIRSSVRETSFTYDKKAGKRFETVGSEPTKFNTRDKYSFVRIDRPIDVDKVYSDAEKKTNPVYKEYKGFSTSARSGESKQIRSNSARNRGYAFEKVLQDRIKSLSLENKTSNEFSRLDGTIGPNVFEAKSEKEALTDKKLSEKMVSAALSNKSKSEKNMSDRLTSNILDSKANTIGLGSVILFQDTTSGLGQAIKTETKNKKKTEGPKKAKGLAFGGYVQKLMAGQFVKKQKGKGGRTANVRMNDWTLDEVLKIPSTQLSSKLGIDITEILRSAGSISGDTAMSPDNIRTLLGPYSKNPTLKSKILSSLVVKANKIVEDRRNKANQDTNNAISSNSLFGAIGMFGSSFPPTDVDLDVPGLDDTKKIRVFGQVLDKNKIERKARLAQMDQNDPNRASIEAAPTAAQRAKKYTKAYLKTVGQGVQTSYVDEIIRLLDPRGAGLKAFFDFDKTLAFNTDPITEQQKLSKGKIPPMDDKTSKAGMYAEFYQKASVARGLSDKVREKMGLAKTKPSALFNRLVALSRQVKKRFSPADYNKFLSRLHIITARPQSTVGSIASWVNSRGLNIPLSNFTGVGAKGTSAPDIGLAKANVMVQALGQDKGVFVDDDPDNIAAASGLSGIQSFLYKKTKSSMGRATRKGIADTQGNLFEEEIRQTISKDPAAANIWTAMSADSETHSSIDFPYGIGSKIATSWFNNPLLAGIPVDAKRTLKGPRGKIVSNIKNFLKARAGFAGGGMVQRLMAGGQPQPDPDVIKRGTISYLVTDVIKAMSQEAGKQLNRTEALELFNSRDARGDFIHTNFGGPGSKKLPKWFGSYKAPPSAAMQGFLSKNATIDANLNRPESYRGARSSGRYPRRGYAKGDVVRDPKNTLEKYFENSKYLNAGLLKKGMLGSAGRKEQAERMKDMRKLETSAPPVLYNSLSRAAFDSMAMQVGLNKNPEFPPGTKYLDQERYYAEEVAKISGKSFKLPGYLSTSLNNNKAKMFLDNAKRNKDNWASFMTINTKPKAKGVDVVKQLKGRKAGGVKTDKLTGQTLYQKPPESEEEFILRPNSKFRIKSARFARPGTNKNIWMDVQQFKNGGYSKLSDAAPDTGRLVSLMYKKDKTSEEMKELDLIQKRRGAIEKGKIRGGGRAYGKIGLYGKPEEGEVKASYTGKLHDKERFGTAQANRIGPKLFAVSFANVTKGFGPKLYDTLMEEISSSGGRLTSDRGSVTPAAQNIWKYYFKNRKDVFKTPLPKQYWTADSLLDPRLKGPKSEWPPYSDADAWALQSSYFKAPSKIKEKSSVVRRASGGEIPIMAQEGEYVINRKSAKAIGYGNLNRLNKYHTGGKVQKFARGSWEPLATAEIDPEAQRRREEAERRRLSSEAKKRRQEARRANAQSMIDNAASSPGLYNVNTLGRNLASNPEGYQILREKRSTVRGQARMRQIDTMVDSKYAGDPDIEKKRSRLKRNALTQMAVADTERKQQNQARFGKTLGDAATALGTFRQNLSADFLGTLRDAARKTAKSLDDSATAYRKNRTGGAEALLGVRRQGTQARQTMDSIRDITTNVPGGGAFGRGTRPVSVYGTSSADLATMTGQSKIDIQKAKKQALIDAGYGKQGAQTKAIQAANRTAGVGLGAAAGMSANQINNIGSGGRNSRQNGGDRNNRGDMMGRAMTASFLIPMITDMFVSGEAKTESQARSNALTQGIATTAGSSLMMGSMVNEMTQGMGGIAGLAGPVAMFGTAIIGLTSAVIAAENAAREMAITLATKDLETSIEITSSSLQKFAENLKDQTAKDTARAQVLQTIGKTETLAQTRDRPQRGFANLFDSGENSNKRSEILFKKGTESYIQTLQDPISRMLGLSNKKDSLGYSASDRELSKEYASLIPARSRERAKDFQGASQATQDFLSSNIKSGTSISDLKKQDKPQFDSFIRSLALADASIQEQIMNIENSTSIQKEQKDAMIANIIAQNGERKARELQSRILKEKALEELNRSANHLQNSLERMFQNMEQAIARNVYELNNLSQQAELSAAALSGNAKAGQVSLKSINVLQNPRAYNKAQRAEASQNAANMFGSESGTMKGLLQAGGTLEDTIMSTINKTMKEDPNAGNEKIGIRIQNNISKALESLQLPPDVSEKLGKQVNEAIGQIRQKGDEKIDFGDLMEKIPQLGKVMDSTRRAQEAAIKALEHWQNNLNDYSNAMNQMVESSIEANSRFRRSSDIQVRGQMELDKALGKEISLRQQLDASLAGVKAQTGGQTNPALIAQNVRTLETQRATQQSMSNTAGQRGYAGTDEFMMMQDRLRNTNIALRENYDALKSMADNTEMASIAMAKINEIQQKRQAGVNMAERLVTSSPQELSQLNRAMDRLNNNMQGGINFGSSADQRKESLDAFNMIAPFLGEKQNGMKANVLESMLIESGVGINPMMADVLQALRNPEADPEMQEAITAYKKAVDVQSLANTELGNISMLMSQNTAEIAAAKLVSAMKNVPFTFENAQLKDIADEIKTLRQVVENKPAAMAPGKANGGIIYASAGQMVNFQPKGTDTVPAMLTPGEFVVNRSATQKHLPLLKNINSGNYSNGGKVKYYADGGYVATDKKWSGIADEKKAAEEYNQTSQTAKGVQLSNINWNYLKDNNITKEKFYFFDKLGYVLTSTSPEDLVSSKVLYKNNDINQPNDINTKFTGKSLYWGLGAGIQETSFNSYNNNRITRFKQKNNLSKKSTELPSRSWLDDMTNVSKPILVQEGSKELEDITSRTEMLLKDLPTVYPDAGQILTTKNNRITYNPGKLKPTNTSPSFSLKATSSYTNMDDQEVNLPKSQRLISIYGLTQPISNATDGSLLFPEEVNNLIKSDPVKSNTITIDSDTQGYTGGGNFLPKIVSKPIDSQQNAAQVVTDDMGSSASFMTDYINKINLLQENISSANFKLKDTSSFKETEESLKLKEKISNFQNLFNNTVASAEFTKNIPGIQSPLRLYNENISTKWDTYSGSIKKIKETKPFSYSVSKPDFIEMKDLKDGAIKNFAWTDGGFTTDDYDQIFREAVTSPDMVQQPVITSPVNYDKNGVKFSYIKYDPKSRLYLENERRFGQSFEELGMTPFTIIPSQGNDETMKSFNPFLGIKHNILSWPEKNLENYIEALFTNKNNLAFAIPKLSASNGIPYSPIFNEKEKNYAYIDHDYTSANLDEFFKAREANMEKIKNETALSYAKTDFSIGEYAKIDDAKKITLAREFYKLARLGDDVPPLVSSSIGKKITSVADIGNAAINIGSKIPTSLLPGDYEREKIDAWRAVFAEIYNLKDTKSSQTLQDLGVDLSDKSFDGYGKVEEVDDLGDTYTKYWNGMNVSQDLLQKIINRQIMSNMTKRTSTKFRQNEDDELSGDSYTFGTKGAGKIESAEQALPDSWNRLREVALDPQRIFPNTKDRSQLIDKLIKFYNLGKNEYGEDLLPDDLKKEKETRLSYIDTYFSAFDQLLNTGLKTGESDDADAEFPYDHGNRYSYKYFADSLKAISSDEGKTDWNRFSSLWQDDLNLETGRDTLNANQVEALIRASAQLKEEDQKKKDNNNQGVGNEFAGVQTFATGGPVYANKGTLVNYQPRGTDTVPAMLTPGEFVINRKATQKHLPVLKAINDGYYTRGGIVNYLSNGGIITPNYYETAGGVTGGNKMFDLSSYMGNIVGQISSSITLAFQNAVQAMSGQTAAAPSNGVSSIDSDTLNKIGEFTNRLKSVADTLAGLSAIPQEITITVTHTHNVIINGDAALNKLSPDLQDIAMSVIQEKFAELAAANQIAGSPLINPFQV